MIKLGCKGLQRQYFKLLLILQTVFLFLLVFFLDKVNMSRYPTPDKVSSLLFVDNNEDSSTIDKYLDDDDCNDYVPSDDDNENNYSF